jgi:hypothetical protein
MAAFATTVKFLDNGDGVALAAAVDAYMETLDSTNDPIGAITFGFNSKNGKYFAIILTT